MVHTFTPAERALIRRQFGSGWGEPRRLREGLWLHRWASGPNKGQPKLGKAVQSLLARGLVEIVDPERGLPSAQFTAAGLEALRTMADDARQLDPARFGHLLEDLSKICATAAEGG